MTDYTKATNFASKDSLASGNSLKIVKGTEIDTEFNSIATSIATKADLASPTFTGTVTIPTATITTATISAGTITGITDLAVADGGTGASTAANARTNLGLVIGTNVQAWDADLDTWATKTAPSGTVVGTTDSQTLTNKTLTSPSIGGTPVMSASIISSATAVASTSGTSIDFTGIPSWVKRITVMFFGVSTSGSSSLQIQIGSGSFTTSGYVSQGSYGANAFNSTTGLILDAGGGGTSVRDGSAVLTVVSGNSWINTSSLSQNGQYSSLSGGRLSLGSALDRIRITTVNGTDTFDSGSINILYE